MMPATRHFRRVQLGDRGFVLPTETASEHEMHIAAAVVQQSGVTVDQHPDVLARLNCPGEQDEPIG